MGRNKKYDNAYSGYKKAIDQYTYTAQKIYDHAYKE